MAKFRVTVIQTYQVTQEAEIVVEAESEKEATDKAESMPEIDLDWIEVDSEYFDREVTETVEVDEEEEEEDESEED